MSLKCGEIYMPGAVPGEKNYNASVRTSTVFFKIKVDHYGRHKSSCHPSYQARRCIVSSGVYRDLLIVEQWCILVLKVY